jgi:hypothetical protein
VLFRLGLTGRLRLPATTSEYVTRLLFVSAKTTLPAGTRFREKAQARAVIFTVTLVVAAV